MSASSATTLISPTATVVSARSSQVSHHPPAQRRQSSHSSHAAHGHHQKRRASHHHAHSSHGMHRRPSEAADHGRRAMAAGLAMQVMDVAGQDAKGKGASREVSTSRTAAYIADIC